MLKKLGKLSIGLFIISSLFSHNLLSGYLKSNTELLNYYIEYKEMFESVCARDDVNRLMPDKAIIKFAPTSDPNQKGRAIGVCTTYDTGDWVIRIDPEFYKTASNEDRYSVVMHELTHCVLHMDHSSDQGNYMYWSLQHLPKETIIKQMKADMKAHCAK